MPSIIIIEDLDFGFFMIITFDDEEFSVELPWLEELEPFASSERGSKKM